MKFSAAPAIDEVIAQIVGEMRRILNQDLDETDIALAVQIYNDSLKPEHLLIAWETMGSTERASWKAFAAYDEWLRNQRLKLDA